MFDVPAAVLLAQLPLASAQTRKKGVLLMNRIGPSSADLYIANADGTGERKFLQNPIFEYNACFSADGKSVLFTSERNGDDNQIFSVYDNTFQQYGQIFIMNADGSDKRMLTDSRWEDSMPLYIPAKFL